ncbi:unnamed protein product [Alopecurus aequalis]
MGRKKVNLQYIPNNSKRRGTFQKRSRGLMKKAGELSTLCGTNACVIIYGEGESKPQVFPSHDEAVAILNWFKDILEQKRCKNTMDQEYFLLQQINNLQYEVQKYRQDYQDFQIRSLLHKAMLGDSPGLMGLSVDDLTSVGWKVEVLLKSIGDRTAYISGQQLVYQCSSVQAPTPNVTNFMEIIGPVAPNMAQERSPHKEEWFNMVRSRGPATSALAHHSFNIGHDGATTTSDFNNDKMIQPFDLGDRSVCP